VVHALLERILRDREHERRLWADLMANRVSAGSDNDDDSDSARLELEDKYWREERRASVFEVCGYHEESRCSADFRSAT
jgi:hypothetical protein